MTLPYGRYLQGSVDLFSGLGQQDPFGLLHDPALQGLGGVAIFDVNRLLGDDLAAVGDLVDEVDGGAGDFHTVVQSGLMDTKTVEAFAAEAGDQGGVDIDDPLGPLGGEFFGEDRMSMSGLLENIVRHHIELYSEDFEHWKGM